MRRELEELSKRESGGKDQSEPTSATDTCSAKAEVDTLYKRTVQSQKTSNSHRTYVAMATYIIVYNRVYTYIIYIDRVRPITCSSPETIVSIYLLKQGLY